MRFARQVLVVALTVAVGGNALDCIGMTTPERAMQCCKSMRCMSHRHHGQDCCKTMPTTQVDVGQPTPVSISFTPIVFGTVELFVSSPSARTLAPLVADQSHAPPILSPPTVLPLRI